MGCGKSTLGKKLAKNLGYSFIDSDKEIENLTNQSIEEIFDIKGEKYFRLLETEWLQNENNKNTVISVGGGTPCYYDNLNLIHSKGISIYLKMNSGLLTNRLFNSKQKRPLIEKFKHDKLLLELEINKLLTEREIFYNSATIIFDASNMSPAKMDLLNTAINGCV